MMPGTKLFRALPRIGQIWYYFKTYNDHILIKTAVIAALLFDVMAGIGDYSVVYLGQ